MSTKIFTQPGTGRYPVKIRLIPSNPPGDPDAQISLELDEYNQARSGIFIATKNLDEFIKMLQEVKCSSS